MATIPLHPRPLLALEASPISGHEWLEGGLQAGEEAGKEKLLGGKQLFRAVTLLGPGGGGGGGGGGHRV